MNNEIFVLTKYQFDGIKKALVTGSSGLVGSETVKMLCQKGFKVYGIDNNLREYFFGTEASTESTRVELESNYQNFFPVFSDIRNREEIERIFKYYGPFDLIVHAAAQPAHDWSIDHPYEDFEVNALGTLNMLENFRKYSPQSVYIQVSTSKVYGDNVNKLPLLELERRFDLPQDHKWFLGVDETMSIENSIHSLFGVSKTSGDLIAQEYGKYFNLKIAIFRPVCVTGPSHKGAKLHGYLSYLVKCIANNEEYTINGYMGKQVRDNIHSFDLVSAFWEVYLNPKYSFGEVYNIGAGRLSNNSMIEAIEEIEMNFNKKGNIRYSEKNRTGDHKWCIFNPFKFQKNYPNWKITYDNEKLIKELCESWLKK